MRVLSPRMLPPVRVDDGSTASTATRRPAAVRSVPSASMNVDLPDAGNAGDADAVRAARVREQPGEQLLGRRLVGGLLDSTSVIARPSTVRFPASTPSAYASTSTTAPDPVTSRVSPVGSSALGIEPDRELVEEPRRGVGDHGARREDRRGTRLAQGVEVLRRDDATDDDHDVGAADGCELGPQLGHEREVTGGERRHADDVHVGLDGLAGDLGGRLEQRADVDVEAEVGERGGDHLLAAVVTVLAHLGDEDARPTALALGERVDERADLRDVRGLADLVAVHTRDRTDRRRVPPEHLLEGAG